jgi:hypothetical protein
MLESNPSAVAGGDVVLDRVIWLCPARKIGHYIVPKAINSSVSYNYLWLCGDGSSGLVKTAWKRAG